MANFREILDINTDKTFATKMNNSNNLTTNDMTDEEENDLHILDPDEEFEKDWLYSMICIKTDFRKYIEENYLKYMNELNNVKYNFFDFIKENSVNYDECKEKVEEKNEEYFKELEELETMEDEEAKGFEYYDKHR